MSDKNYTGMTDKELFDHVYKGELGTDPELYSEFVRRLSENGNTPEDAARWKAGLDSSATYPASYTQMQAMLSKDYEKSRKLAITAYDLMLGSPRINNHVQGLRLLLEAKALSQDAVIDLEHELEAQENNWQDHFEYKHSLDT